MSEGKIGEATEYFATYGWLFIFLMGCIVVIFVTGFLSFGLSGGVKCIFDLGFSCTDLEVTPELLSAQIFNQKPTIVEILSIEYLAEVCSSAINFNDPLRLSINENYKVELPCKNYPKKGTGELIISYQDPNIEIKQITKARITYSR